MKQHVEWVKPGCEPKAKARRSGQERTFDAREKDSSRLAMRLYGTQFELVVGPNLERSSEDPESTWGS